MMFLNLRAFQHLVIRAYVRHVMLFVVFPYHVAQKMRRNGALYAASVRRSHRHRFEDHRWLR
jgi:hypothetical protein